MLLTVLTGVYVFVALILIFFVLVQDPKGGAASGIFGGGGGSNSLFGSTGSDNFFTKVTKGAAIAFALISLALTYLISHPSGSVMDNVNLPPAQTAPATTQPTTPAAPAPSPAEKPAETK